ncbi:MAG: Dabb family protein [Desulfovibrio sp.]|nr:Dabb family protein [Desulfovibrio sp.]
MVRHIVWWTLKGEKPENERKAEIGFILDAANSLRDLPSLKSLEISATIEASTTVPCDLVLTTTHDSVEKLNEYQKDPIHKKFGELLKQYVDSRSCVDFSWQPVDTAHGK